MDNELLVCIRLIEASYAYSTDFTILLARVTYYGKDKCLEWYCSRCFILVRLAKLAMAPYNLFLKDYAGSLVKLRYI
jgi:hypothetical protein